MKSSIKPANTRPASTRLRCAPARLGCLLLAAGALGAAGVTQAATVFDQNGIGVDLYGILDAGIGTLEHSYAGSDYFASTINPYNLNGSPHSFTGLYTGGISMSRVGLKGEAELGSGRKVFFKVESAINVTSGELSSNGKAIYNNISGLRTANAASAINGQAFARAAYLGASDPAWGSLELGRTVNLALDQVVEFDPLQAALLYSPLGFSGGIGGGLGATENTRLDDSLRYENKIGGINLGVQYKLAGDKGGSSAGYGWVAMLGYSHGPLSVKGTFSETTNTVTWPVQYSNVVPPDPNVQVENTKGYMLTGLWKITADATVKAGYENLEIWAPSNPNLSIDDYYGLVPPKPSVNATGQQRFSLWWVGGDYKFTPAFDLGIGCYDIDTYNQPESGKNYLATAVSVLADYSFTRKFDAYAGVMLMQYSGAGLAKKAPALAYSNNALYGVGLRFKF
ncbi:MAG TPA: porin [Steroidobacteraceae bacterium]